MSVSRDNSLVTGDPNIRFYAGAPLRTKEGAAIGTLCVLDYAPRQLSERQKLGAGGVGQAGDEGARTPP